MLQADSKGPSVDPNGAVGPMEIQESGESSNAGKESQGDAARKKSNQQDQSSQNEEDTAKTKQPLLDQNGNMDKARQSKQKSENEEGQKQTVTPASKQKMVFGPHKMVVLIIFRS